LSFYIYEMINLIKINFQTFFFEMRYMKKAIVIGIG